MDGFDWTLTQNDYVRKYDGYVGGLPSPSATYKRGDSGYGISQYSSSNGITKILTLDTYDTITVGFAVNPRGSASYYNDGPFLVFWDSADVRQVEFCFDSSYQIVALRGDNTVLGTSSVAASLQNWHHIQVKVYVHDSSGTVDILADEQSVLSLSSQDTRYGNAYISKVSIYGLHAFQSMYYDDYWITNGEFLGDCRVKTYFPDSDETHTDFTRSGGSNNYEMVDESDPDDDSTYNEANFLNAKDSYGVTPSTPGPIKAVQIGNMVRKTGSEGVIVKNLIRSGGSDYNSTEDKALTTDYGYLLSIHETDPDDSNPWTQSKITSAEFGLQITSITTTTTT